MILKGEFWVAYSPNGSIDVWRDEPIKTPVSGSWVWCDPVEPSCYMHWTDVPSLDEIEIDGIKLQPGDKYKFEVRNGSA